MIFEGNNGDFDVSTLWQLTQGGYFNDIPLLSIRIPVIANVDSTNAKGMTSESNIWWVTLLYQLE